MAEPTTMDYAALLADLQARRDAVARVIQGLDMAIEGLSQLVAGGVTIQPTAGAATGPVRTANVAVQSDTFFRMSIGEATKKFLEMAGQPPRSLASITDALNRGGLKCKPGSVATIVGREAEVRGFVKVGSDWGLESWYRDRAGEGE
jgi:hypothetical protein